MHVMQHSTAESTGVAYWKFANIMATMQHVRPMISALQQNLQAGMNTG